MRVSRLTKSEWLSHLVETLMTLNLKSTVFPLFVYFLRAFFGGCMKKLGSSWLRLFSSLLRCTNFVRGCKHREAWKGTFSSAQRKLVLRRLGFFMKKALPFVVLSCSFWKRVTWSWESRARVVAGTSAAVTCWRPYFRLPYILLYSLVYSQLVYSHLPQSLWNGTEWS